MVSRLRNLIAAAVTIAVVASGTPAGGADGSAPVPGERPAPPQFRQPHHAFTPAFFFNADAPLGTGGAGAEVLPGPGWWTELTVFNWGLEWADIVATAYDANSPTTYTASATIRPGGRITWTPADFAWMPQGFQGSVAVSSNQPVRIRATLSNRLSPPYGTVGGLAQATYEGSPEELATTPVLFPVVRRASGAAPDVKTSTIFVQNTGPVETDVHIAYACNTGNYAQTVTSVDPFDMVVLNPAAAGMPPGSNCRGAASSSETLVGLLTEHFDAEAVATLLEATRGLTGADAATELFAPTFRKRVWTEPPNATRSTAVTIQNVSTSTLTITATYRGVGAGCSAVYTEQSPPVAPGATHTFIDPAGLPDDCLAGASFNAGGNLLGLAQEAYRDPPPPSGTQSTMLMALLPADVGGLRLHEPRFLEKVGNRTTALQVQNVSAVTATVSVVFRSGANSWTFVDRSLAPGGSADYYLVSECGAACWVGGNGMPGGTVATAEVIADQRVVAEVVELPYPDCYGQSGGTCLDRHNAVLPPFPTPEPPTPTPTSTPTSTPTYTPAPTATPTAEPDSPRIVLPVVLFQAGAR